LALFPSNNIYMNNLAQAIEIVNSIDHAIELIESTEFKPEPYKTPQVRAGSGIGVIEAPRGTLYYALKTNEAGLIDYINLVIPTAQNHQNMEKDVAKLVQDQIDAGAKPEAISLEAEKLIRAYDPCMSCATHFLKLKMKSKGSKRKPINPWTFEPQGKKK
ncbi:MAG: nickel-dependent hydrogenase large subunit, partial [Candidatus Anstonellaceae archaeon]